MSDEAHGVGLADAIATVGQSSSRRSQLGKSSALAFRAGPVGMEFQVSSSRTETGRALSEW
ncbi:MAG: hypothetical protein E6G66_07770 [Actinobacteria bacterium]|nr:MAG: hypothetical protein E6G66_07770 [Actinomycetota bacterium]